MSGDWTGGADFGGDANFDVGTTLPTPDLGGAAGGAPGLGDFASKVFGGVKDVAGDVVGGLGSFAKSVLPVAQLGATGLGIAGNLKATNALADQAKLAQTAQAGQVQAGTEALGLVKPVKDFGTLNLQRAENFQISPAAQAQIDEYVAGAKAQMHDYLARSGQGDSESLRLADAMIDRQALAMKQQMIDSETQAGLAGMSGATAAAGAASGANTAAFQGSQSEQAQLMQLIATANAAVGRVTAGAS